MARITLIDNYDSFVHNLARYFEQLGQETTVVRNDAIDAEGVRALGTEMVVLSPGPCTPAEAGCSVDLVRALGGEIPILGVCLGHQAIGASLGGNVIRATEPMHGRSSMIRHDGRGEFVGFSEPFAACRYHSLVLDETSLPEELEISARSDGNEIMGVRHRRHSIVGWQFHPESVLTDVGYWLLENLLDGWGISYRPVADRSQRHRPIENEGMSGNAGTSRPVTF